MRSANAIAHRDPDAAALLTAQAGAACPPGAPRALGGGYDPLDVYTHLAREFGWSDAAMDGMDYVRFFGYVDRLNTQREREQAEADARAHHARGYGDAGTVVSSFPEARPYAGRTVSYG